MRCPVYRSLDKPSAFFGIRGRFTSWMVVLLVVDFLFAFLVGAATTSFLGIFVFVLGAVGAYVYVMSLQGKQSDRDFALKMNSKKYPRYVRTPPGPMRRLWRGDWQVKSVD